MRDLLHFLLCSSSSYFYPVPCFDMFNICSLILFFPVMPSLLFACVCACSRAKGELVTPATWMRSFVTSHAAYKQVRTQASYQGILISWKLRTHNYHLMTFLCCPLLSFASIKCGAFLPSHIFDVTSFLSLLSAFLNLLHAILKLFPLQWFTSFLLCLPLSLSLSLSLRKYTVLTPNLRWTYTE